MCECATDGNNVDVGAGESEKGVEREEDSEKCGRRGRGVGREGCEGGKDEGRDSGRQGRRKGRREREIGEKGESRRNGDGDFRTRGIRKGRGELARKPEPVCERGEREREREREDGREGGREQGRVRDRDRQRQRQTETEQETESEGRRAGEKGIGVLDRKVSEMCTVLE